MFKDFWESCNVLQKIVAIFYIIMIIGAHILSIYGLIDANWVEANSAITPIITRILFVLLLIACIAFDMLTIVTSWFLDD